MGKGRTLGKVILEAGKAAIEWVSAHVNDFRVRQDQMDQARPVEIARILVDKE